MHSHGPGFKTSGFYVLPTTSTTSFFTRTLFSDATNAQDSCIYLPNGTEFSVPTGSAPLYRLADNSAAPGTAPTYKDVDGVQRPGDGWWSSATVNTLPLRTDGETNRSIHLNRPFTNLAELGYVFRDTPWKSLDLVSSKSADAGLLDVFTLSEGEGAFPSVAGRVALNSPHQRIMQALIKDVASNPSSASPTYYSAADADTLATALTGSGTSEGYLYTSEMGPSTRTPVGISGLVVPTVSNPGELAGFLDQNQTGPAFVGSKAKRIKGEREGIVRALAGTTQGGTWNILIDVTAQVGRYPKGAKTQQDFLVLGEKRYWLSIAIDRFTGKIIGEQLEPVTRFDP
ncbi:hypothetical protein DB346_01005 [Verrucomicrobia bacterium LW23]|nr:hypothetical protein DB346_01005 [Verrucomicrobia bacterium LW23]